MAAKINKILDELEAERETKFFYDRSLRQFKGFREDWNEYYEENADNFSMD